MSTLRKWTEDKEKVASVKLIELLLLLDGDGTKED